MKYHKLLSEIAKNILEEKNKEKIKISKDLHLFLRFSYDYE